MGTLGNPSSSEDGEAVILSVSDAGEVLIRLAGGARTTLQLSEPQLSSYRQAQLRERARAGTLAQPVRQTTYQVEVDLVIGDRNWFYC